VLRPFATLKGELEPRLLKRAVVRYIENPIVVSAFLQYLDSRGADIILRLEDHTLRVRPLDVIGKKILRRGAFHRDIFERAISVTEEKGCLSPGGVLLEIGANIGTHTIYAHLSGRFRKVVAIEPGLLNFQLLQFNGRENGFEDATQLIRCAAGRSARTALLYTFASNCGKASLVNQSETFESVEVRPTDSILDELSIAPQELSMVWTDVEGSEEDMLAGMPAILAKSPPLVLECHLAQFNAETIMPLLQNSYSCFVDLRDRAHYPLSSFPVLQRNYADKKRNATDLLFLQ
jgi:FkbM family methyltransferase